MDKQAYLIIAHDKFEQLQFLLSVLDYPQHDFFIHIDQKATISQEMLDKLKTTPRYSTVYFTPRMPVYWGHYSQIECELLLFDFASQHGPYSMYHLISGVDLPLQPAETIYQFFEKNKDFIFITRFNQDEIKNLKLHKLVEHYHFSSRILLRQTSGFPRKLLRSYRLIENKIQTVFSIDRLKGNREKWGLDAYANWKSIGHNVVTVLLDNRAFIQKYFRHTYCADEFYLSLVLTRAHLLDRIYHKEAVQDIPNELQGNLRYINWWDGHPYEWTDSEKDKAQLDQGIALGHLFSRKFNLEKYPGLKNYILEKTASKSLES